MIRIGPPRDAFEVAIALCWLAFLVVWVVSAPFVKRTVERSLGWPRLLTLAILIAFIMGTRGWTGLRQPLWPRTPAFGAVAVLLTLAGLAVAIWARAVLGSNWSGAITLKEGHELIQRGPYSHVRHPIYSGLLLMGLGTAIDSGRASALLFFGLAVLVLGLKARAEERLMLRHFPEAYGDYRQRVKALIPGVW